MKIYDFKKEINNKDLNQITKELKDGNLVIFPTETVYGIGANAFNEKAINKIFEAKGRKNDNPLIVHVSDYEMINACVKKISPMEKRIIDYFMPGPLTLILPKKDIIPQNVTSNLDTVGIRMPNNKIAHSLIKKCGFPIAAPSANISTKPSGTKIEDIIDEFKEKVSIIIDGGESDIGLESTVLKVIDGMPTILRPGKITDLDIKKITGKCIYSPNLNEIKTGVVESPGLKYKHYAPTTPALLIYNDDESKMIELIKNNITSNTIIIGFYEHQVFFNNRFISLGHKNDLNEISHNIFSCLRKADLLKGDLLIIEGVKKDGIGIAIMNRLIKSCNHNYIDN